MTANLTQSIWRAEHVRQYELQAAAKIGIDSFTLMHRAGEAVAHLTHKLIQHHQKESVINVFVGVGNNGGDGYIVATALLNAGFSVQVIEVNPETARTGDASTAKELWHKHSLSHQTVSAKHFTLNENTCVIDAMLGTGLTREVSGQYAKCIEQINQTHNQLVVAVDIPSGIDANTGAPQKYAVWADHTVTFVATKPGLVTGAGKAHCGELHIDTLGIQTPFAELISPIAQRLHPQHSLPQLPKRPAHAHKGMFGHVVIIGGNHGMSGAVRLAAHAALRCGAGLVSVLTHQQHQAIVATHMPELMVHGIADNPSITQLTQQLSKATHIVIGPGLGKNHWATQLLTHTITHCNTHNIPSVFDADALNLLSEMPTKPALPISSVFTPHPAEAARLLKITTKAVEADRYVAVKRLAQLYNATVLLKGAGTLICSPISEQIFVNTTGNAGMATAGMGDVLSGVIGALLAQNMPSTEAACYGAYLHGAAGDKAAQQGTRGLIASDLFPFLRQLIG